MAHGGPIDRFERDHQLTLFVDALLELPADIGEDSRPLHVVEKRADILRAPRDDGDREDDLILLDLRVERRDSDVVGQRGLEEVEDFSP